MNLRKNVFETILLIVLIGSSNIAVAGICTEEYAILNADIDSYLSDLCDKCYASAKGKISGSEQKANVGKIADAIDKLDDLSGNLDRWLNDNKPKITQEAYDVLVSDIASVISSLNTVHP